VEAYIEIDESPFCIAMVGMNEIVATVSLIRITELVTQVINRVRTMELVLHRLPSAFFVLLRDLKH
jgi:hypothetical protein